MKIIHGFIIAFSKFSKLPIPFIQWEKDKLDYVYCFWPLVGFVLGFFQLLIFMFCSAYKLGYILRAALFTITPIFFTGGTHIKGYMTTHEALSMRGTPSELLAFMELGHIGSVSIVYVIAYTILSFCSYIYIDTFPKVMVMLAGIILSRALASTTLLSMECVKKKGTFFGFCNGANKLALGVASGFWIIVSLIIIEIYMPILGIFLMMAELIFLFIYTYMATKKLGGITGDTTDYYQMISEIIALVCTACGGMIFDA
ncbi:MAG: adenosylcobinamide-GDP ribazoletransferase [Firmicutes bacterium]|nr:adenosylcobinamide-GDP ribazoletransferase [Bacillota bacterium]